MRGLRLQFIFCPNCSCKNVKLLRLKVHLEWTRQRQFDTLALGIRPQLIFKHLSYSIVASKKIQNSPGTKQMTDSNRLTLVLN